VWVHNSAYAFAMYSHKVQQSSMFLFSAAVLRQWTAQQFVQQ